MEKAITQAKRPELLLVGLAAAVLALLVAWPTVDLSLGGDHYMYLARSFASGTLDVDAMPSSYRDYVPFDGHKYLPFGPLPAVLLMPFTILLGNAVPLVIYCYAVGVVNVFLFVRILRRLGVTGERSHWLVLLYFGGTMYLSVTLAGISTFFAHAVTTTFLLGAILESLGKQRFIMVGLMVGLAAATRMTALFSLPFFTAIACGYGLTRVGSDDRPARNKARSVALLIAGLALPLGLVAWYNYARFGDPAESGFAIAALYSTVLEEARAKGLFSVAHIPKNLFMMLLAGPLPVPSSSSGALAFPYLRPSAWGMGIFFVSPALVYLFRASLAEPLVRISWITVAAIAAPIVLYYGIGYVQFGYRYALDFMPFLMLILAVGITSDRLPLAKRLIAASVVINIWGAITLAIWI